MKFVGLADYELVESAVAGREASFEELVRRYQRPIAAYVYRMVGNYDAALDLTQEVFIKVYNSLSLTARNLSSRPGFTGSRTTLRLTTCVATARATNRSSMSLKASSASCRLRVVAFRPNRRAKDVSGARR